MPTNFTNAHLVLASAKPSVAQVSSYPLAEFKECPLLK